MNLDQSLYQLINQNWTNSVMDFLMFNFSEKLFWIPLYVVLVLLIVRSNGKKSIAILFFLGLSVLFSDRLTSGVMKPYFKRIRPCHVTELNPRIIEGVNCSDTGSMASSHAANHFAIALFMILLAGLKQSKLNRVFWISWAFLVAYSRVYLGVHYPSDVLVGGVIGALIGFACFKLYSKSIVLLKWA
ncbi:MAG: phosphatase PAP2 family protein [Bacteroidia bacterium]|nr:phosphatase PAP2 family protein [Bacteroidia bacterium]